MSKGRGRTAQCCRRKEAARELPAVKRLCVQVNRFARMHFGCRDSAPDGPKMDSPGGRPPEASCPTLRPVSGLGFSQAETARRFFEKSSTRRSRAQTSPSSPRSGRQTIAPGASLGTSPHPFFESPSPRRSHAQSPRPPQKIVAPSFAVLWRRVGHREPKSPFVFLINKNWMSS
jgi:hypothetical protein